MVNRLPGMCWASLASWAMKYPTPLRECRQTDLCHTEAWQDRCYCGKVRIAPDAVNPLASLHNPGEPQ